MIAFDNSFFDEGQMLWNNKMRQQVHISLVPISTEISFQLFSVYFVSVQILYKVVYLPY